MISIVICTRNRPKLLERCLNALAIQCGNFEVIIVDQSDSVEPVKIDKRFRRIVDLTRGLSKGRNKGIQFADGDIIAFLDDDAVPAAEYMSTLEKKFQNNKKLDAVAGRILNLENEKPYSRAHGSTFKMLRKEDWQNFMGGNFAIRLKTIEKVGLFDERFGAGCKWGSGEETDIFLRLIYKNFKVAYLPEMTVRHPCEITDCTLNQINAKLFNYGRGQGALLAHHILSFNNYRMLLVLLWEILKPCIRIFQYTFALRPKRAFLHTIIAYGKCLGFFEFVNDEMVTKKSLNR